MDTVFIENLVLTGVHGVTAKEQRRAQPFKICIEASVDCLGAGQSDDITEASDYRRMKSAAEIVVTEEQHSLVECVAERIAEKVLEDDHVKEVVVTVKKLTIWNSGVPGVTIRRKN